MSRPTHAAVHAVLALALLSACVSAPQADPAQIVRGPLATRVQHPFSLTLLSMRPRRAVIQEEGTSRASLDLAYSSIHEVLTLGPQSVHFDGETARSSVRVRRGIGNGWDVESEASILFGSSGFLDAFIEGFHEFFGFPDAGRPLLERDQYRMRLRYHGQRVYDLVEDEYGFGDVPVIFTKQLQAESDQGPGVALRFGLEFPIGSAERGFGNGEFDFGLGTLFESSAGRWTVTGALDFIAPGRPEAFESAGLSLDSVYSVQAGLEFRWSDSLSLLTQLAYVSPYTRDYPMEEFSSAMIDFALGCAWQRKSTILHFAILEDLAARQGPDFGIQMGASWGF
ncbi:MAG: DUF3187 family protein [Planctomycetota bacterium]|nr:DUF3187 family protein [Planctomycetota bacterium]